MIRDTQGRLQRILISVLILGTAGMTGSVSAAQPGMTDGGPSAGRQGPQTMQPYGGGYGYGPGMMGPGMMGGYGYGPGMMGPGMTGGYGYGPGMMGPGMMGGYGYGPGMMGPGMTGGYGYGPGMMGPGMMGGYGYGPGMMGPGMMGPGFGTGPMSPGYGGRGSWGAMGPLNLSEQQQKQIADIRKKTFEEQSKQRGQLAEAYQKMQQELSQPKPDQSAVSKTYDQIAAIRKQMLQNGLQAHSRIAEVLTEEQRRQLRGMYGPGAGMMY